MAHKGANFNGGTTRAKLSTLLSHSGVDWFEIEFKADAANTGDVYLGPVTVTSAGVDAWEKLDAGENKKYGPYNAPGGFRLDPTTYYVVGSAAAQICRITAITAEGRRIPIQSVGTVTDS